MSRRSKQPVTETQGKSLSETEAALLPHAKKTKTNAWPKRPAQPRTGREPSATGARPGGTGAQPGGNSIWLLPALAVLSVCGLIAAVFLLPDSGEKQVAAADPNAAGTRSQAAGASQARDPASPAVQSRAPAGQPHVTGSNSGTGSKTGTGSNSGTLGLSAQPTIQLPTAVDPVDTESEQAALLASVEKGIAAFPRDAEMLHIAALTYAELLQSERAVELFDQSLTLDPRRSDAVVAYADVLLQTGKQEQAVGVLKSLIDLNDPSLITAAVRAALGEATIQLGELEQAVDILEQGVQAFPDSGELHLKLSQAENQLQRFTEAEQHARRAIELGTANRAAYLSLSTALLRLGMREEALDIRRKMPSIDDEQTVVDDQRYQESFRKFAGATYVMLGLAYAANSSAAQGEAHLLQSLRLDPTSPKSLAAYGDFCHRSGRLGDALQIYERLIEVQPENLVNYANCASLAISAGNFGLAEKSLAAATQRDPSGYADLYFARYLLGAGQVDSAAKYAQTAVERSEDVEAYLVWITALQSQGKRAFALDALMRARQMAPGDPRLANIRL